MRLWQVATIPALAVFLISPPPDFEHVPTHAASCEGITVGGTKYTSGGAVDLVIGTVHAHHTFAGPTFSYDLGNPDKTKPEPWSIVIVSNARDGSATYEGTIDACEQTSTTSTVPSTTSTVPSTTSTQPTPSTDSTTTTAPDDAPLPSTSVDLPSTTPLPSTTTTTKTGRVGPLTLPKTCLRICPADDGVAPGMSAPLYALIVGLVLVGVPLIWIGRKR